MNENYHEMILDRIHDSGLEEWYCPICGRRFLVQWPPAYKMIILQAGDKDIRHNVSKVNPPLGSCQITKLEATDLVDEFRLVPFLKWMDQVDFDKMWGKNA